MHRILVADDSEDLRLLVVATLEDNDYELIEARDGVEALATARAARPSLVVIDWMMPGISGIDVIRILRQEPDHRETPVILLTARTQDSDRELSREVGVNVFLAKPFSPADLIQHVERLLA